MKTLIFITLKFLELCILPAFYLVCCLIGKIDFISNYIGYSNSGNYRVRSGI